jgi:hypothetical protein
MRPQRENPFRKVRVTAGAVDQKQPTPEKQPARRQVAGNRTLYIVAGVAMFVLLVAVIISRSKKAASAEFVTQEINRLMPDDVPQRVKDAYVRLVVQRMNSGKNVFETLDFLRGVAQRDPPRIFLAILIGHSGEVHDEEKKRQAYEDEQLKHYGHTESPGFLVELADPNTGKRTTEYHHIESLGFLLALAYPVLEKYPDWDMLSGFVANRIQSDSKPTLAEYAADPKRYDKMNK